MCILAVVRMFVLVMLQSPSISVTPSPSSFVLVNCVISADWSEWSACVSTAQCSDAAGLRSRYVYAGALAMCACAARACMMTLMCCGCRSKPVMSFPLGQGLDCPPLSDRLEVSACTVDSAAATCSTCDDGVVNAGESDVDCGGSSLCGLCGSGAICSGSSDCAAGLVCGGNSTCLGMCGSVMARLLM